MGYIDFQDKGFEKAIKAHLGVGAERLTQKDIARIQSILICTSAEKYLKVPWQLNSSAFNMIKPDFCFNVLSSEDGMWEVDLQHFHGINALYLYGETTDLSLLSRFTKLQELHVVDSQNQDWSFLGELLNLRCLLIKNAPSLNLEVFRELANKQEYVASERNDPFLWSHKLEYLRLTYCGIEDVSPLTACKWLTEVDLSSNAISNFRPLLDLPLNSLTLQYNRLSDLAFIGDMDWWNLYSLNLQHNEITDISPLARIIRLRKLFVGHNPITDFTVMEELNIKRHDVDLSSPEASQPHPQKRNKRLK